MSQTFGPIYHKKKIISDFFLNVELTFEFQISASAFLSLKIQNVFFFFYEESTILLRNNRSIVQGRHFSQTLKKKTLCYCLKF